MEKPGLEQAVMIWGAGASMIHIARNMSFTFEKNYKKEKTGDLSGSIDLMTGWAVKVVMGLIMASNVYHIFFTDGGHIINYFGAGIALVYFFFFGGFFTVKEKHPAHVLNTAAGTK